jgi:hypothetical protein
MTLTVAEAEAILRSRFGEPANPLTDYAVGFRTPSGKVLAVHREASETLIWFQPPAPPSSTMQRSRNWRGESFPLPKCAVAGRNGRIKRRDHVGRVHRLPASSRC